MANIEIRKAKIGKILKDGLTKNGMPYKSFTVAEGIKQKNGTYENMYFNCFVQGDLAKSAVEGMEVAINGSLSPNNYTGKDGKKHYGQTMFVKNILPFGVGTPKTMMDGFVDTPKEEPTELPFD